MSSEPKEKSPKIIFTAPKQKVVKYNLDEITPVHLPGITTITKQIPNQVPNPVPEVAVNMSYTHQQFILYALNKVDPALISAKRSHPKSAVPTYDAKTLKEIAKNVGLEVVDNLKKNLAPVLYERVMQLRTEGESQAPK
jgi:hypothetical protein